MTPEHAAASLLLSGGSAIGWAALLALELRRRPSDRRRGEHRRRLLMRTTAMLASLGFVATGWQPGIAAGLPLPEVGMWLVYFLAGSGRAALAYALLIAVLHDRRAAA